MNLPTEQIFYTLKVMIDGSWIIVLVRHGQTNFNRSHAVQDPDTPFLTEEGVRQAETLKRKIFELQYSFRSIVCSEMKRTIETLRILYPNYETSPNVHIDNRLNERYHKNLIGKTKENIEKELNLTFRERFSWQLYFEGTERSFLTGHYPENESLLSVQTRLVSLLGDYQNATPLLLIGSSIINQYLLEFLRFKTIGFQKVTTPDGDPIEFQQNNEIRTITVKNDIFAAYSSITLQ